MAVRMRSPCSSVRSAFVLVAICHLLIQTEGFQATDYRTPSRSMHQRAQHQGERLSTPLAMGLSDEDESGYDEMMQDSPEKSQMYNYISNFLSKENAKEQGDASADASSNDDDDDLSLYTHLIAFPVDACHDLMLELESVQRAILYHCPVLVHACITQAMTRLPLFYVQADADSALRATNILRDMVQESVQKHVFVSDYKTKKKKDDEVEIKRDDGTPDMASANEDGIRPLMLTFSSLEIDGPRNEVLNTVADLEAASTIMLQELVKELRERITKETGWKTALPPDDQAVEDEFRPRIPFMRLPVNWDEHLRAENQASGDNDDDDEEDILLLSSDQGGNGISPIFWCQWWEDTFGTARMRETAVYTRRKGFNRLDEQAFYLPANSVQLPKGNAALIKEEAQSEKYQERRMAEAENFEADDQESSSSQSIPDNDPLLAKTRDRLEALYQAPGVDEGVVDVDVAPNELDAVGNVGEIRVDDNDEQALIDFNRRSDSPEDPNALDDWTRERIQKAVASRARVQSQEELAKPKDKPPITDNPIFSKFKDGTLVPASEKVVPVKELPPFPSREHCTGFWRVVNSPTGFAVEEGDSSRSDNLVLRVDGTTAGGPILDQVTRQKASGGTWRMTGDTPENAQLRVRLVIPPTKERILVMEGQLKLVSMMSDLPMASSTFGIPQLEAKAEQAAADMEDILYCGGSVWIEDAVTGDNRKDIGDFSLMKLHTPTDPSQYTITVPKPVRNQD